METKKHLIELHNYDLIVFDKNYFKIIYNLMQFICKYNNYIIKYVCHYVIQGFILMQR